MLDLPVTGQLLDQQPAVRTQQHLGRAQLPCPFEPADRRCVLGDVVGRLADALGDLGYDGAVIVGDLDTDPRGPGVAPGRAVAVQRQAKTTIRRQYSHLFTPSVRFRRSSSTAESLLWRSSS